MAYDYDSLYGTKPYALGPPTDAIVALFGEICDGRSLRVLDVGCGQGRDALFIARQGHAVVGIDLSPNGIADLLAVARLEGLAIEGVVADITQFTPRGAFDLVLFDRTLHMLALPDRLAVLSTYLGSVAANGWVLIADQPGNLPDFRTVLDEHQGSWSVTHQKRGLLLARSAA